MRVAFLGPAGTFTEEALRASAAEGVEARSVKQVHEGRSELELSPEEQEAIATAMGTRAGA